MTVGEAAKACGGRLCETDTGAGADACLHNAKNTSADIPFQGVVIDSRKVEPGNIFFAIKGEKTDGHNYISKAFESGAVAVVAERLPQADDAKPMGPVILAEDSAKALSMIDRKSVV